MALETQSVTAPSTPPVAFDPGSSGTLMLGAQGPQVEALQRQLNQIGENLPVNGQFGPRTQEAVRRFQRAQGLLPMDGVVRPKVAAALAQASRTAEHGGWSGGPHAAAASPASSPLSGKALQDKEASAIRSADSQFVKGTRGWELEKKRCLGPLTPAEAKELNAARTDPKQSKVVPGLAARLEQFVSRELAPAPHVDPDAELLKKDPLAQSVFANPVGWSEVRHDDKFAQRLQVRNGHMYTETKSVLAAPVDQVVAQLRGPWDWWHKGTQTHRVEHAGTGDVDYELKPTGFGIDVNETMHQPERLPDGGVRIQIDMKGPSVFGKAYFEVHPDGAGHSVVYGRFAGATTPSNPLQPSLGGALAGAMGPETVAKNHLLAEAGQLPAYLGGPGTGWVGLGDRLGWGGKP